MMRAEEFADRLIALGWLKFTPSMEVELARGELVESLRAGTLDTEWDNQGVSRDRRSYPADSEELAERPARWQESNPG